MGIAFFVLGRARDTGRATRLNHKDTKGAKRKTMTARALQRSSSRSRARSRARWTTRARSTRACSMNGSSRSCRSCPSCLRGSTSY